MSAANPNMSDHTLLPSGRQFGPTVPSPIGRNQARLEVTMDTGIGPIDGALDMPMFNRVVVNLIHMMLEIALIANPMLPIPALPDATLALRDPTGATLLLQGQAAGEAGLDQTPAQGVIGIALR